MFLLTEKRNLEIWTYRIYSYICSIICSTRKYDHSNGSRFKLGLSIFWAVFVSHPKLSEEESLVVEVGFHIRNVIKFVMHECLSKRHQITRWPQGLGAYWLALPKCHRPTSANYESNRAATHSSDPQLTLELGREISRNLEIKSIFPKLRNSGWKKKDLKCSVCRKVFISLIQKSNFLVLDFRVFVQLQCSWIHLLGIKNDG